MIADEIQGKRFFPGLVAEIAKYIAEPTVAATDNQTMIGEWRGTKGSSYFGPLTQIAFVDRLRKRKKFLSLKIGGRSGAN